MISLIQRRQGADQIADTARFKQKPIAAIAHQFGDAANARADHWAAKRFRFEHRHRAVFAPFRGDNHRFGLPDQTPQRRAMLKTEIRDVGNTFDLPFHFRPPVPITGNPQLMPALGDGFQQCRHAF